VDAKLSDSRNKIIIYFFLNFLIKLIDKMNLLILTSYIKGIIKGQENV